MKNNNLLKRVSALGFPLFDVEVDQSANLTLADMVKSRDLRLWEGFPVVLANSAERGLFNYSKVSNYLKNPSDKSCLDSLMLMSLAVYRFFGLKFSWADEFYKSLVDDSKKQLDGFYKNLRSDNDLGVAGRKMSAQRLKTLFNNYFSQSHAKLNELVAVKDELSLEYALAQVFSPKQKELFLKKLKREKLTKTEKEYFSRVVKKKVLALANPDLHRLSQKVLE
jgi:hypothetical protein